MFGKVITKISSYFFKDLVLKLEHRFKGLSLVLNHTNINEDTVSYISNILFISLCFIFILEFFLIFLMLKLSIFFNFFSFIVTIFVSGTFGVMVFLILYKFPYYLLDSKKKELDIEVERSVRHLSVLKDENLTIRDILVILQNLDGNRILTVEAKRLLTLSNLNNNLRDTLLTAINQTYSESEKNFFFKLIDVIDKKDTLSNVIVDYLGSLEQSKKEINEQKKSRINLLFQVNVFLFFLIIILVVSLFLAPLSQESIKSIILFISIVFPIIEFILIVVLYK